MTTTTVSISATDIEVTLESPYDPALPAQARSIGGRWDASRKLWTFDPRDEARVRQLARDVFGTDGADADRPTVTVRVPVPPGLTTPEFRAAGRQLAWRPGRDDTVHLGGGVIVYQGGWNTRGGSMRYPRLGPEAGTVLEVRDVPADQAERMVSEVPGAAIVDGGEALRAELVAERAR
ncbi:MAG: hypothetical protein WA317_01540, partial [Mycobacterium sp.]|uniref:hypothetical protein n=1 Tax=Mycobacterium sp. TaxID=1785 RepID=UPI003CC6165E